jgi:hypothetical protein
MPLGTPSNNITVCKGLKDGAFQEISHKKTLNQKTPKNIPISSQNWTKTDVWGTHEQI